MAVGDAALAAGEREEPARLGRTGQGNVRWCREVGEDALGLALLGDEADATGNGSPGRSDPHRGAVEQNSSLVERIGAENCSGDLCPSSASQPGQPDDFTGVDGEGDVLENAMAAEALDLK